MRVSQSQPVVCVCMWLRPAVYPALRETDLVSPLPSRSNVSGALNDCLCGFDLHQLLLNTAEEKKYS